VCVDGPEVVVKPSTAYKTTTNKTHKGGGGGETFGRFFVVVVTTQKHTKAHLTKQTHTQHTTPATK
jgi:hypothetical protein